MLIIAFKKAIAPLAIIAEALAVIVGTIVGWQLSKVVSVIPLWAWILGGITGVYCFTKLIRRKYVH